MSTVDLLQLQTVVVVRTPPYCRSTPVTGRGAYLLLVREVVLVCDHTLADHVLLRRPTNALARAAHLLISYLK